MKCPVCKRDLATNGGYVYHMKTHVKKGEAVAVEKTKPEPGDVTKYAWSTPFIYLKKK